MMQADKPWWQPLSLAIGESYRYEVGPLALYLRRSRNEWLLASEPLADDPDTNCAGYRQISEFPSELPVSRCVFKNTPARLRLRPRLLDRAVVVRTQQPLCVPPGEDITFYISSPVLVEVSLPEVELVLAEVPVSRLSDTWFGPSTRVGELCYASKTSARLERAEVPLRPHRAVTPVTVNNSDEGLLTLDKLSIPLPCLGLYGQADGTLWTDAVNLRHHSGDELSRLTVDSKKPAGELLDSARIPLARGGFVRAFTNLFSNG